MKMSQIIDKLDESKTSYSDLDTDEKAAKEIIKIVSRIRKN